MTIEFVVRDARLEDRTVDIAISAGHIAAIETRVDGDFPSYDARGRIVTPGFVDTHIHLDKALLSERCVCERGTLEEALSQTKAAKARFTFDDIYDRASRVLALAIGAGTTQMRTHVEVDPDFGMLGYEAVAAAAADAAWGIDVQLCVFPQEGLHDNPGTEALLHEGLRRGAGAVGAVPYVDRDPRAQIDTIFELARDFDVEIDMHLDFFDHARTSEIAYVCSQTERFGWGGRVTIGHVTTLAHFDAVGGAAARGMMADCGVALTVLPATDQYLMGSLAAAHDLRDAGVTCAIATNNVQNAFTPFGDASLVRMANLYATLARTGTQARLRDALDMITYGPAKQMRLARYGVRVGSTADLVVLDARSPEAVVAAIAPALWGMKRGRVSFERPPVSLFAPERAYRPEVGAPAT